ncbi:MAG: FAD-dependent monooxygenase, partial [Actinobacteria bacterium]|nr:FAD-dependent monooxygenase [Actinomycetota bacterium]
VPFPPALHYWIVNPDCPSFMGPLDTDALWWLQATALSPEVDLRKVDATALVRSSIAVDVEVEVVTTDPWEAHALMASRLREGRVFLAGDAAHVHTPMGAHGMNMGIGDAVDLGWKLAAVLDGWAQADLLDTYAIERSPLHERVLEEATRNYANLPNHFLQEGLDAGDGDGERIRREVAERIREAKLREFSSLGLVLGSTYRQSPIVVQDGMPPVPEQVVEFTVAARAGRRIPHAWLDDRRSLFDRLGSGYTLLCFGASTEAARLAGAAAARHLPLAIEDVEEPRVAALFGSRLALVRPDQILAWHGDQLPADPDALLDVVTARRPPPAGNGERNELQH